LTESQALCMRGGMYYLELTYPEADLICAASRLLDEPWITRIMASLNMTYIRVAPWQMSILLSLINDLLAALPEDDIRALSFHQARLSLSYKVRQLLTAV